MKDSQKYRIYALVFVFIGAGIFLGIIWLNPEYNPPVNEMWYLTTLMYLSLGIGAGIGISVKAIRRLEEKIPETPPPS
jgi:hypothetical protein